MGVFRDDLQSAQSDNNGLFVSYKLLRSPRSNPPRPYGTGHRLGQPSRVRTLRGRPQNPSGVVVPSLGLSHSVQRASLGRLHEVTLPFIGYGIKLGRVSATKTRRSYEKGSDSYAVTASKQRHPASMLLIFRAAPRSSLRARISQEEIGGHRLPGDGGGYGTKYDGV